MKTLRLTSDELSAIVRRNKARTVKLEERPPGGWPIQRDRVTAQPAAERSQRAPGKPRKPSKPRLSEAQVLQACLAVLEAHPLVALCWRQNTGAVKVGGSRFVKFSFRGASDLMGVLINGRFLAVECKATGKAPSADQARFLANVVDAGGLAIWTDNPGALYQALQWECAAGAI